jgi:hypothetical protein
MLAAEKQAPKDRPISPKLCLFLLQALFLVLIVIGAINRVPELWGPATAGLTLLSAGICYICCADASPRPPAPPAEHT